MMITPDDSEPQHLTLIREATAKVVVHLGFWLESLNVPGTIDEVRADLARQWVRARTTPDDRYLALNLVRLQGSVDKAVIVEMAFAALEASMRALKGHPAQSLQWLLQVENCIGYADGLSTAALKSQQKRQAAKQSSRSTNADALRADVLAFIAKHQPPEGWNRKQAIQHYVEQPFDQTSPFVQEQGFDAYWVGMRDKLRAWLRLRDFSKAFDALLKG